MRIKGFLRTLLIIALALTTNLFIFGLLTLLNWQKTVHIPSHLGATEIVHLATKKPEKTQPKSHPKKAQRQPKKSLRKLSRPRHMTMDKFLRNVNLSNGLGTMEAPELFIPQKEDLGSILQIETGLISLLNEEAVDLPPRPIYCKRPDYPRLARLREIEGLVEVEFVVTTEGIAKHIAIIKSLPEGVFDKAVLRALRIWRFEPAQHKGKIVECRCAKRFRFVLTEDYHTPR